MSRDIQYESLLERDFLLVLEDLACVVTYQEQPFVVPYDKENREHCYYPDVFFVLEDGRGVVVEVKPTFRMALHRNLVKWSALRAFCRQRGYGLLVTDGRYAIQQVQRRDTNPSGSQAVLEALQHGSLSWHEYRMIRDRHKISKSEFLGLILQNRLVWELGPFRLSLPQAQE
jgi:hypothetical protein